MIAGITSTTPYACACLLSPWTQCKLISCMAWAVMVWACIELQCGRCRQAHNSFTCWQNMRYTCLKCILLHCIMCASAVSMACPAIMISGSNTNRCSKTSTLSYILYHVSVADHEFDVIDDPPLVDAAVFQAITRMEGSQLVCIAVFTPSNHVHASLDLHALVCILHCVLCGILSMCCMLLSHHLL